MSVQYLYNKIDALITQPDSNLIDISIFNKTFNIQKNSADGDCLFIAVSQLTGFSALEMRKQVADFYDSIKDEDNLDSPGDQTLYENILFYRTTDNDDEDDDGNFVIHTENIRTRYVYASTMDVFALSFLLEKPVVLFSKNNNKNYKGYRIEKIGDSTSLGEPLLIKFNGVDHYEAMHFKEKSSTFNTNPNSQKLNPTHTLKERHTEQIKKRKLSPETEKPRDSISKKNVLVMCQRKSGSDGKLKIEDTVVPAINEFIKTNLQLNNYDLKFLSEAEGYLDADVDCKIDFNSKNARLAMQEFKEKFNIESFDYIFLNTCPFLIMDFKAIAGILSEDGKLLMSTFHTKSGSTLDNVFNLDDRFGSPFTYEKEKSTKFKHLYPNYDEIKGSFLKFFEEQRKGEFWYRKKKLSNTSSPSNSTTKKARGRPKKESSPKQSKKAKLSSPKNSTKKARGRPKKETSPKELKKTKTSSPNNANSSYIGSKVKKKFGRKIFDGEVIHYDEENDYFLIYYKDGDNEDVTLSELKKILVPMSFY
jgi:hypothetical protein